MSEHRHSAGMRFLLLLVLVALLFGTSTTGAFAASKPVTFYKTDGKTRVGSITATLTHGTTGSAKLKVRSTGALSNVKFVLSSGVKAVARISPATVKSWKRGAFKTVTITCGVPLNMAARTYRGTLVAKVGKTGVSYSIPITVTAKPKSSGTIFTPGITVTSQTSSMSQLGGTLEGPVGTPIAGVKVNFPPGALTSSGNVSIGYNKGSCTPKAGTYCGFALNITAPPPADFEVPIYVTAPLPAGDVVPVPYYIAPDGTLQPVRLTSIDSNAHTFTFETFHASWYTWLYQQVFETGFGTIPTGFTPEKDGFQITNWGSEYNRAGECLGITAFAQWYFSNAKGAGGDFYPRFMGQVGTNWSRQPLYGQSLIATRAFISVQRLWKAGLQARHSLPLVQWARFNAIANAMLNTGRPVLIGLDHDHALGPKQGGHSVLAYHVNGATGTILIYDPNRPNTSQFINYDPIWHSLGPYGHYEEITLAGNGSMAMTEAFTNILRDAGESFHGNRYAKITVDSPKSGDKVNDRTVRVTGKIESGEVLVNKLTLLVGSEEFTADVGEDGKFNIPVNLKHGTNHVAFVTKAYDSDNRLIIVGNDLATTDFTVECTADPAAMLVTLTWNTGGTDVDLYVTDPQGEAVWYGRKVGSHGGALDHDEMGGYGPEHFTLPVSAATQYPGEYQVRVHYYRGQPPTTYTLTVLTEEGTQWENTRTLTGTLTGASSANSNPSDSGTGWAAVTTVMLTRRN